jgi:hypothetical protein
MSLALGILCAGLSVKDSQVDDNDRKQQKLIHRNLLSCRYLSEVLSNSRSLSMCAEPRATSPSGMAYTRSLRPLHPEHDPHGRQRYKTCSRRY